MTIFNQESRQKQRRKQGLQIAQQAAKLLVNKYAVEKVVLFGSLLKSCPIRDRSDIDLAVWGLANQNYHSALNEVSNLTVDFSFDLVQLESASSSLKQVIQQQGKIITANGMQGSDLDTIISLSSLKQPMNQYAILFSQIEQESQDIEKLVEKNKVLLDKFKATQDEDYIGTIALNLHSFYSGAERILKQIAQTVDGSVPDTPQWHRQLLRQMATPIRDIRPAVLSPDTFESLNDYCSFRHVVRNLYTFSLKSERVKPLAEALPMCWHSLHQDLESLISTFSSNH